MDFDLLCLISMYEAQIYAVWIYSKVRGISWFKAQDMLLLAKDFQNRIVPLKIASELSQVGVK